MKRALCSSMHSNRMRVASLLVGLAAAASLSFAPVSVAGPGHDHGDAPQASTGDGPARAPDGSVFLPKPSQRQLQIRTQIVEAGDAPRSMEGAGAGLHPAGQRRV